MAFGINLDNARQAQEERRRRRQQQGGQQTVGARRAGTTQQRGRQQQTRPQQQQPQGQPTSRVDLSQMQDIPPMPGAGGRGRGGAGGGGGTPPMPRDDMRASPDQVDARPRHMRTRQGEARSSLIPDRIEQQARMEAFRAENPDAPLPLELRQDIGQRIADRQRGITREHRQDRGFDVRQQEAGTQIMEQEPERRMLETRMPLMQEDRRQTGMTEREREAQTGATERTGMEADAQQQIADLQAEIDRLQIGAEQQMHGDELGLQREFGGPELDMDMRMRDVQLRGMMMDQIDGLLRSAAIDEEEARRRMLEIMNMGQQPQGDAAGAGQAEPDAPQAPGWAEQLGRIQGAPGRALWDAGVGAFRGAIGR